MAFAQEKRTARRLLAALEDGTLNATDTAHIVNDAEPVLVFFIFSWLRAWYPASHPASDAVLGRLGELCTSFPKAARMAKEGEADSMVQWFDEDYAYRDLRADEFITLIVEKLES